MLPLSLDAPEAVRDGGPTLPFFNYRLLLSFALFLLAAYTNGVVQVYVQNYNDSQDETGSLPDLGYRIFPKLSDPSGTIPDIWVYTIVGVTIIYFAFKKTMREKVFRRLFFLGANLLFLRAFTISVTMLAEPPNNCKPDMVWNSPWLEGFFTALGIHRTCSDLLFSGHTSNMLLAALVWQYYSDGSEWRWLKRCGVDIERYPFLTGNAYRSDAGRFSLTVLIVWILFSAGCLLIITTRFHYSVDVFIAIMLTTLYFKMYHQLLKSARERKDPTARFMYWFEGMQYDETSYDFWPESIYGQEGLLAGSTTQEGISTSLPAVA
jgi:hypothetical protein